MRNFSRFIPEEEIAAVAEWHFGSVDASLSAEQRQAQEQAQADELAHLEEFRQAVFAEGMAHGRDQAMQEAQRQIDTFIAGQGQETARQLATLLDTASEQLDAVEQQAAQGVLDLACALARQVLRHELSINPNVLLPVIREALSSLLAEGKTTVLRLHPLDLDMLQDTLRNEFPALPLSLQADARLNRGGCRVESAGTVIDASLETRWARAVARLGRDFPWQEEAQDDEPGHP